MSRTTRDHQDDSAALIAAGAVLPGAAAAADDRDTITARRYRHPALDDRVVVRLVPEVLGAAEDLTCEYLGFAAPESAEPVGTGRRSALGFPAWALIHDPANAHHALALVKEVERLARTARSRAGAAKDGFTALGEMLGRSAPHFLPTFYEQAGRAFLDHGNTTFAATMFGKAREAEEVHDLRVDPDRTREVFLEFAFAGALTAKALSAHAKGLARKHDPVAAHELFRTLCVERTRGGLAPYTGMPEDLRRLAKAAGLDLGAEDERLLRAILDSTAVNRAGAAFWKAYRASLVRLATADEQVRAHLLTFVPDSAAAVETWLGILEECGATDALTAPVPREGDTVLPAEWLSQVVESRANGWRAVARSERLLTLVEWMGPRLAADGREVRVLRGWRQSEVDLLDLLLALGVPVRRDSGQRLNLDIRAWLADEEPGRRDLVALAATPDVVGGLAAGFISYANGTAGDAGMGPEAVRAAMSVPGLRTALRHWITARAASVTSTGLPVLDTQLDELSVVRNAESFVDAPEAAATIAATDVAGALRATLRTGLVDELGWPALDEAVARLRAGAGPRDEDVSFCGEGWPAVVLRRGEQFVVVGPDGVLAEHTARIPADDRRGWGFSPSAHWYDGVLLVRWPGREGERAYWSNAPEDVFTTSTSGYGYHRDIDEPSLALPGGARWSGGRAVHPGDTAFTSGGEAHSDGTTLWTRAYTGEQWRWVEVDPATGERGRASLPRFLEDFAADGARLDHSGCYLHPATPATAASPLGAADGLHGWRVRVEPDESWLGEGVDGRRARLPKGSDEPIGVLALPGDARLVLTRRYRGLNLLDAEGTRHGTISAGDAHPEFAAGTPLVPPLAWWHVLRPRDEAGSAALRAVSDDAVRALLAAAAAEPAEEANRGHRAEHESLVRGEPGVLAAAVTAALPGLTHSALVAGVVEVVRRAQRLVAGYAAFGPIAAAARSVDAATLLDAGPVVTEGAVEVALGWFGGYRSHNSRAGARTTLPEVTAALVAATQDPQRATRLPESGVRDWFRFLGRFGAVAYRAASPLTPDDERDALVAVLRAVADSGLLDTSAHWRTVAVTAPDRSGADIDRVFPVPGGFVAVFEQHWRRDHYALHGVQYAVTPGEFRLPEGWVLVDSAEPGERLDAAGVHRFLAALAEHGPVPWVPGAPAELAEATGLGTADAAVLLAGMPEVDSWGANYLTAAERKVIGLSSGAAKAARQLFKAMGGDDRRALLAAAVPTDPAALWTTGVDLAAVAEVWVARHGRRVPVPEDVLVDGAKLLATDRSGQYLAGIANPAATPWLTRDSRAHLDGGELKVRDQEGFGHREFLDLPRVLLWLAQRLPAGSPLRERLPEALELLRARTASPEFGIDLGHWNGAAEVCGVLGIDAPAAGDVLRVRPWLHVIGYSDVYCRVVVHPGLVGEADLPLLTALMEVTYDREVVRALELIRSDGLTRACAAAPAPDGDPTAFHQDPSVSVPHLVTEVAQRCGLDDDAAVLYLQLLALADPTDANTARWTGWKPARLRAARAALAATDLVLSAKRARAGRSLFLPGGWLALGAPHLPLERWKAPLFGFTDTPDGVIAPLGTVAELFTRAWQRVLDGDAPAYEELTTGGRR
ncbi:hypothetical protein [Actinokineospora bangkokensis]|uniref:DNA-binding protein n=1 Tax=Actinokineospora bangkokensis TaxID=1193682 RepID=A0A1Q9LLX5_9PSEU|nr:hypothetical protein [Actinokineospora bangkokensis]OLR93004.1 hypothetical protein BJP25_18750 [Actinokineospora bangkokensis]